MRYVLRFDVHQRLQHLLLLTSFIILAVTGLPLLYRYTDWGMGLINAMGGVENVRGWHRLASFVMIFAGIYHILWALAKRPTTMIPRMKDVRDFIADVKFAFGMSNEVPEYHKFSYVQKFEYWGAFWGMVIMISTGLVLSYPDIFSPSGEWFAAFRVAHWEEAILAVVFIASWHMYFSHLRKKFFPFNKVIFTGRMELDKAEDEHPLWVEEVIKRGSGN
ncbi:formate dehydrogenase subunit gamma [Geoglobus acetivorans]|uniref:Hydrogenase (NiFe), b-type cytochrome subunit n=1 Tax=Geoglobus acetivorans TaxID=565033 RepID=A0A0A7GFF4_GEOAI|nr:hydrogenase (NiFe), b-type cytochrome subunit [Geoglobus acetivorans]